jgi:exopolyphosphatase/pppGpp-phosphohydrolase
MQAFKLDFGKLAYAKTEDLAKRLKKLEQKKQKEYGSLFFKYENIIVSGTAERQAFFKVLSTTDLNISVKLQGSGSVSWSYT